MELGALIAEAGTDRMVEGPESSSIPGQERDSEPAMQWVVGRERWTVGEELS